MATISIHIFIISAAFLFVGIWRDKWTAQTVFVHSYPCITSYIWHATAESRGCSCFNSTILRSMPSCPEIESRLKRTWIIWSLFCTSTNGIMNTKPSAAVDTNRFNPITLTLTTNETAHWTHGTQEETAVVALEYAVQRTHYYLVLMYHGVSYE